MHRLLKRWLQKAELLFFRSKVNDALSLQRRGEVRTDGLELRDICNRLEICWRARDVHPWDRGLRSYERETVLADQTLVDTEATITRLFERLPHVDVIEVRVLEATSEELVAEGTVHRSDVEGARTRLLSVGMRLREMGMRYRLAAPERYHSGTVVSARELCAR